jgi:hypothetical protein
MIVEPKMYTEEYDFDSDVGLGEFLESLEKYKATIVKFVAIGPGGGHPAVTLSFATPEDFNAFNEFMDI